MQESQNEPDHVADPKSTSFSGIKKIIAAVIIFGTVVLFITTGRLSVLGLFLLLAFLGDIYDLKEYRGTPTVFLSPTEAEIKARAKRNIALAAGLLLFVILVFVTMVSRGQLPNAV